MEIYKQGFIEKGPSNDSGFVEVCRV